MKHFSIVVAGLAMAALLCAQDKPPAAADAAGTKQENYEAAIIPVKTLTGDSFDRLSKLLGVFNVRFVADEKLRTIVVYAPKDVVEQMRKVVEQLDQPGSEAAIGRNIDMTLAFLRCSTKAPAQPSRFQPISNPWRGNCEPRHSVKMLSCGTLCRCAFRRARIRPSRCACQTLRLRPISRVPRPSVNSRFIRRA